MVLSVDSKIQVMYFWPSVMEALNCYEREAKRSVSVAKMGLKPLRIREIRKKASAFLHLVELAHCFSDEFLKNRAVCPVNDRDSIVLSFSPAAIRAQMMDKFPLEIYDRLVSALQDYSVMATAPNSPGSVNTVAKEAFNSALKLYKSFCMSHRVPMLSVRGSKVVIDCLLRTLIDQKHTIASL